MTRAELARELAVLERAFENALIITRVFLDADGNEVRRITRAVRRLEP